VVVVLAGRKKRKRELSREEEGWLREGETWNGQHSKRTPSETSRTGLHEDERDRIEGERRWGVTTGTGDGTGVKEKREERSENRDNLYSVLVDPMVWWVWW
jgi:hypothetical protein